jgi:hypothetical protein
LAHWPEQVVSPAWQEIAQAPALQIWPALQGEPPLAPAQSPEAPQKSRSAIGSTHFPPQNTCPARQLGTQAPAAQTSPDAQATPPSAPPQVPEAPQCARSVSGSVHWPLQSTSPAWQLSPHCPPEQSCPSAQAVPADAPVQVAEAPQWFRSVPGSMQLPPQLTCPAAQVTAQAPLEQTFPAAQEVPQAPQFRLSDLSSAQVPPQTTAAPRQSGLVSEHPTASDRTA